VRRSPTRRDARIAAAVALPLNVLVDAGLAPGAELQSVGSGA